MNIEEVKKRNNRRKELMKDRENTYNLVREIEYNRLVEGSVKDMAYLLSIVEQQDLFIKKVSTAGSPLKTIDDVAKEWINEANELIRILK